MRKKNPVWTWTNWTMSYASVVASMQEVLSPSSHVAVEAGSFVFIPTHLVPTCVTIHAMWAVGANLLTIKVNLCSKLVLQLMQASVPLVQQERSVLEKK